MNKKRFLPLLLVALLLLALLPATALAAPALTISAYFEPSSLSAPGGVTYHWAVANSGSYKVSNIQVTADGTVIGSIASLGSGEKVTDKGYVELGEGDLGRAITFAAKGYATVSGGGGLAGMTSNTGRPASSGTQQVSAACTATVQRAAAVPVITQPVPVISQPVPVVQQPVPVIQQSINVIAKASVGSKTCRPGDTDTLTVQVRNAGNTDVSNVKILLDNRAVTGCSVVPAGTTANLTYDIPITGPVTLKPVITYVDYRGEEVAQALNSLSIAMSRDDLRLTLATDNPYPSAYQSVDFLLELTNTGNDVIQNLQLYDLDHQAIGGPLGALYPGQSVQAELSSNIPIPTNVVFYVEALEGGGRISAQSNTVKILPR